MKKHVQILLLLALFPLIGTAREETMEERKQRIVRKYLRERMTIAQSDMVVPSDLPEDERITESEKFKEPEVNLQKQEGAPQAVMPPPPAPRPVPRADSNWLLGDLQDTADASDPYADPFAPARIDTGEDLWSSWDTRSGNSETARRAPYRYDPYSRDDSRQGAIESRSQQGYAAGGQQGAGYSSRTDLFGRQQDQQTTYSSGLNLQGSQRRTYGSDPSEGLLANPFSHQGGSSSEDNHQRYQPYKSSYQQQREERMEQRRGTIPKQQTPDFKRADSYQQWKERNKVWDPTADDAYINEMMQQNR